MSTFPSVLSCKPKLSCSSLGTTNTLPIPNKYNFTILFTIDIVEKYNYCVALIDYPDCNTRERYKVCIFKGISSEELKKQNDIDPHFVNDRLEARLRCNKEDLTGTINKAITVANFLAGIH